MTTIKEILTENRESVISSLKFIYKIWKAEEVKAKMIEFLAYAEKWGNVENLSSSKRVKTDLKDMIIHMKINAAPKSDNRKWYEIAEDVADSRGLYRDSLTGNMYKVK